jgi:hypothetical protein
MEGQKGDVYFSSQYRRRRSFVGLSLTADFCAGFELMSRLRGRAMNCGYSKLVLVWGIQGEVDEVEQLKFIRF